MAKKDESRPAKSKMTVMVFQLEGNDETIQEGLRRVSDAVNGMVKPPQRLLAAPAIGNGPTSSPDSDDDASATGDDAQPTNNAGDDENAGDSGSLASKREVREKAPQIVSSMDPKQADVTLESFASEKHAGESASRRYLVAALWLREHMKLPEFSVDHIYTCFRWMKWTNIPDNPRKFLRNLKSGHHYFDNGSKSGFYTINHLGEKEVNTVPSGS